MTQTAKAQEPSMEEILASIRRIIADDDAGKPGKAPETATAPKPPASAAAATPAPAPLRPAPKTPPPPAAAVPSAVNSQDEIDAMLAELDGPPKAEPKIETKAPPAADVL